MVLVSGTFTFLARLAGAIASKTLGWAVIVLFGRVPADRQRLLSLIALGALLWLICVAALLVPAVARLVVAAVPRPGFVPTDVIGWLLIAGAVGLPAVVGAALAGLDADRASGSLLDRGTLVLRGYAFTPALAGVIVFLAAWTLLRTGRAMRRGWSSQEIPLIVKPGAYDAVTDDVGAALTGAGLQLTRRAAPRWFEVPPRLLAAAGGFADRGHIPRRFAAFKGDGIDILVYPSAVTFTGRADLVTPARAAVMRRQAFAEAYLTTTKQAEQAEDWLRQLFRRPFAQASDFEPVDALLATESLPPDDWDVLFRLRYQVEHEVLVARRPPLAREA
jgi:hypothetical protein